MDLAPPISRSCPHSVLTERALVLNRSWIPVHLTTVRRALVMLYQHAAVAVQPETYETFDFDSWSRRQAACPERAVRTTRGMLQAPDVILLSNYDRIPGFSVPFSRRNLCRRDHHRCQYCGRRQGPDQMTIDHVLPRSQGGSTGWSNCVLACTPCNRKKGCRTPDQAGMKLLASPARPDWTFVLAVEAGDVEVLRRFERATARRPA